MYSARNVLVPSPAHPFDGPLVYCNGSSLIANNALDISTRLMYKETYTYYAWPWIEIAAISKFDFTRVGEETSARGFPLLEQVTNMDGLYGQALKIAEHHINYEDPAILLIAPLRVRNL